MILEQQSGDPRNTSTHLNIRIKKKFNMECNTVQTDVNIALSFCSLNVNKQTRTYDNPVQSELTFNQYIAKKYKRKRDSLTRSKIC